MLSTTATTVLACVSQLVLAPPPAPTPDVPEPALVEKNRQLTAKMHVGERWMIGGRLGVGVAIAPIIFGVIALSLHRQRKQVFDETAPDHPYDYRGRNVGIGVLSVGVAGMAVSTIFTVLGDKKIKDARAGRLGFSAGRRSAGHTFTRHF